MANFQELPWLSFRQILEYVAAMEGELGGTAYKSVCMLRSVSQRFEAEIADIIFRGEKRLALNLYRREDQARFRQYRQLAPLIRREILRNLQNGQLRDSDLGRLIVGMTDLLSAWYGKAIKCQEVEIPGRIFEMAASHLGLEEAFLRLILPESYTKAHGNPRQHLLVFAAFTNNEVMMKSLLEDEKTVVDFVSEHFGCALTAALNANHTNIARTLVQHGANVFLRGRKWPQDGITYKTITRLYDGDTPILVAAQLGQLAMVKLITNSESGQQHYDDLVYNHAMITAISAGHHETAIHLYRSGLPILNIDFLKGMLLYFAAGAPHSEEMVSFLISDEVGVAENRVPVLSRASEADNYVVVKMLLEAGVEREIFDGAVAVAACRGNELLLTLLLQHHKPFSTLPQSHIDLHKEAILAVATAKGATHADVLHYIRANYSFSESTAHDLLENAIVKGRMETVRLMLDDNPLLITQDFFYTGREINLATFEYLYNQTEIMDVLRDRGAEWTSLGETMWAAELIKRSISQVEH